MSVTVDSTYIDRIQTMFNFFLTTYTPYLSSLSGYDFRTLNVNINHGDCIKDGTNNATLMSLSLFSDGSFTADDVKKLANELGVDEVVFKTAQVYDFKNGNPLIPDNVKYSRYKKNSDGTYAIKNKLLNQCWRMWSSCVITWDGLVVPCCFDKDAKHQLGDLKQLNLNDSNLLIRLFLSSSSSLLLLAFINFS
jgi:hypothetical protein